MRRLLIGALPLCAVLAMAALASSAEGRAQERGRARVGEPIAPLPPAPAFDPRKVELGKKLFHDGRLSKTGAISCASCHPVDAGGTNVGVKYSRGVAGDALLPTINTPTVFNAAYSFKQTWSGAEETLEQVIDRPLKGEALMSTTWDAVLATLERDREYREAFGALYGGVSEPAVRDAFATYMRFLVPRGSKFDQWLLGDAMLEDAELRGYELFKRYGCASCHQGQNVGGNMFARFGVMGDYFADRGGEITRSDMGLELATGDQADRHVFKVPSLRNVALTPPYFHDGSEPTLEGAVKTMARYQLGRTLSDEDAKYIVAFLRTLTGNVPEAAKP